MTRTLKSARRGPASGNVKHVVVFLHGYGADGADLLGLAEPLGEHMPDTAFVAPDAPDRSTANPMGFQWFPIPWLDGSTQEEAAAGMAIAVDDLNAYLDNILEEEGVTAGNLILFGFSQGTMLSLHLAPRRSDVVAGVVAFSGRLMNPDALESQTVSKPPIILIHGDQDDVVPPQSLDDAGNVLAAAGFEVYSHTMKGTGHGIAPDGLGVALSFMRDKLGME